MSANLETSYNKYEGKEGTDIVVVMFDDIPFAICASSDRAKKVFRLWEVDECVTGIRPPADAMDLITCFPSHWIMEARPMQDGPHLVQEITLPRELPVVH